MKVSIKNQQKLIKVNTAKTARLLRKLLSLLGLPRTDLSILFVGDRRMRLLNAVYRGVDRTTDVLSFPQYAPDELKAQLGKGRRRAVLVQRPYSTGPLPLGDIVINLHSAKRQAFENDLSFDEELRRLLIHGLLHLLGYDHEQGESAAQKMQKKSRDLIAKLR
jgi:probable rRNA maturation factor